MEMHVSVLVRGNEVCLHFARFDKKMKRQNPPANNTRWAAFWFTSKPVNLIFLSQLLQTTQDVTKKKNRWNSSHKNTKLGEGGGGSGKWLMKYLK